MRSLSVRLWQARRRGSLSPRKRETGGKGIRTPDLLIANETLYQLSYTPQFEAVMLTLLARFSRNPAIATAGRRKFPRRQPRRRCSFHERPPCTDRARSFA